MGFGLGVHGRVGTTRFTLVRGAALVLLTAVLLSSSVGCGTRSDETKSSGAQGSEGSPPAADNSVKDRADAVPARRGEEGSGQANLVKLTEKGCVQFEPHWTEIRAGQSLTWKSELKTPVTIHVSPGVFSKTDFVVRAGASVSSGPARGSGPFSISTEPAACQGVPRGVQGSGPGVTVEGAVQR